MSSRAGNLSDSGMLASKRALAGERLRRAATETRQAPLSFAQQRLWFLDQLAPNSPLYNVAALARIDGPINLKALQCALNCIVARHEALRTRFRCPDGVPVQVIEPHRECHFDIVDLGHLPEPERQNETTQQIRAELNRSFDLTSDQPIRVKLLKLRPDEHQLILVIHHIAADEWSLKILFKEWATFYTAELEGKRFNATPLPIQYADFARWQREWLQGRVLHDQLQYWKTHLHQFPPATGLLPDHAPSGRPGFGGKTITLDLGLELTQQLKALAKQQEATLFMLLLAAFKTLIYRYTQQDDLIVCTPVAGRSRVETEGLIGFFVNTLPLRTSLTGDPNFEQLLRRVCDVTLGAMAHQDLPFERLVEELHPERSLAHLPFTKLMFAYQGSTPDFIRFGSGRMEFQEVEPELAKFELTLTVRETTKGLSAIAEFNRELFATETISRLLRHFHGVLKAVVAAPGTPISRIAFLSSEERAQLLTEWNQTTTEIPRGQRIHQLFEAHAQRAPHATATIWGRTTMSYGELNARANQLAHFLAQFGIRSEVPVALCVDRSLEMLVGILGILKAGGAYVPMDSSYPKERLAFMFEDTGAPVILTQERLLGRLPRSPAKVICLDADWSLIAGESTDNLVTPGHDSDLAYIMYTSGSTGQPKGVAVPHRAVNRLVLNTNYVQLDSKDRIAQVSNISFDAATFELWGALLNGGQLIGISSDVALSPKEFSKELRDRGITAMFLTTALFNQLAAEVPGAFETVGTVIVGGEALEPKWVREVLRSRPPQRLVNGYGPTENTTFTCCHLIRELGANATLVPLGKPISNTIVYLLDSHLEPVPVGAPGELYAGGEGLARGYWNRPELTAQKFIRNPFDQSGKSHLYRTGDMARRLADGTIEFLGRIDCQIKIRGFRVELGEIETQLAMHSAVRECVVTLDDSDSASKRLVAYVVAREEPAPNASQLRAFLMEKLPEYMIPSVFVNLAGLPLTPNGKIDRKALPTPETTRPSLDRRYVPAQDSTERQLVEVWQNILGVQPIGIQDRFFDLGGHSMLAVRVIAQIEKTFRRKLGVATLFQAGTIQRLAAVLRQEIDESALAAGSSLVEVQGGGSRPPLFLVHGAGGGMFWGYVNLSHQLDREQPVYGFKCDGLAGQQESGSLEDMAARYIADLRVVQPQGPYYLGGYCFGGNVAYEMACQLTEQGHDVAMLVLLNCAPPNSGYEQIPWTPAWCLRFAKNLLHWFQYFSSWTPKQRRGFFRWKWDSFKRKLSGKHDAPGRISKIEPGDLVDLSAYTAEQKNIWEHHIRALMSFRPRPYNGRIHLFRTAGHPLWCSFDEDYGWGRLARGGVELVMVPGAHEKILEEPWVDVLGKELSQALDRAHENPGRPEAGHEPERGSVSMRSPADPPTTGESPASPREVPEVEKVEVNDNFIELATVQRSYTGLINASARQSFGQEHLEYWEKKLSGAPELLDLPADRPRPAQGDYAGGCWRFSVEPELARAVARLANQEHEEPRGIFLSAFLALLHRYTRSEDIVIGMPVSVRSAANSDLVANPENTIPLRCQFRGTSSFRELVRNLAAVRQEAVAHAGMPLAEILNVVQPQISRSYTPIFQVMFAFEEEPLPEASASDVKSASFELETESSKYDLVLDMGRQDEGYVGKCRFSTALFDTNRISRMAGHYLQLLRDAVDNPDVPVSRLNVLSEAETNRLLIDWNGPRLDYPKDKTLASLFLEGVSRHGEAEALVCGEVRLSYAELHQYATRLATRLGRSDVRPGDLVGICLDRSAEMVVAMLGTLLAGAAYVPLDPKYPADRLRFMLEDSAVKALVTQTRHLGLFQTSSCPKLCLDTLDNLLSEPTELVVKNSASPSDLAYVIYTSGSTGKPKGVALEHRNAVAMVSWASQAYSTEELSGVLGSTSICFDLSVFELFAPLCCGGRVILADNALALAGLPAAGEVRLINTVPSAIRELLRLKAVPRGVQVVNLAGEPLSCELVDQIYRETSVGKVFDLYGPTETTTYSTGTLRVRGGSASIGRPLPNEWVYLLDEYLQPLPIGVPGEIFIGGDGVARGYLGQPELTQQKFIPDPFQQGARLYRTGDLGRWREDGNLEYLGRLDHQVKIRGYRIELGEIETVLKNQAGVAAAVVVAREDHGDKRLVAYLERCQGATVRIEELKARLLEQLPDYMSPSDFVLLDKMPMTPNGKIDRKALPAPSQEPSSGIDNQSTAPRNSFEQQLLTIWLDVLHRKQIGVKQNFFALGGHSLSAVRVISGIRDAFGIELPLSTVFSKPTIEQLADVLSISSSAEKQAPGAPIVALERTGDLPVSFVQERLWVLDQLMPGSGAYNVPVALRLRGPLNESLLLGAINHICARHEALRASFKYQDGALTQVLKDRLKLDLPCIDLQQFEPSERESQAQQLVNQYARRPFDLTTGPLIRLTLFRFTPQEHVLLVVMHHTISDGWSLALFFQELAALYDAAVAKRPATSLPTLGIQYPDYAHWQRQSMDGAELERELVYWQQALAGAPAETVLPLDHPRPTQSSGRAQVQLVRLGAESVAKISEFSQAKGCTPFMFFLAGLLIMLRKWTGQEDLVVGTVVAGRTRSEIEHLLGCFMNFLPLRIRVPEQQSALELLAQVRSVVLESQTHQACPFEKIVAAAHPQRRHNQNPLYNIALLLQNFPSNLFQSQTINSSSFPVSTEQALLDLRFEIEQAGEELTLCCEYRAELFEPETIQLLLGSWVRAMENLVTVPEQQVRAFELSPELDAARHAETGQSGRDKIVIASTFTAEPISESIQYWLKKLSLPAQVEFAPFNQVYQQLLDPASAMAANQRGLNVILARLDDWAGTNSAVAPELNVECSANEFRDAIKACAGRAAAPFLVCLCPPRPPANGYSRYAEQLLKTQRNLEKELAGVANLYVLSAEELAKWYPVAECHDPASEELGHVPYTPLFFTALGTALVRKFYTLTQRKFKVIALDCDNTLWEGVCGEDGPQGVRLGVAYRMLQEFMRTQRENGMLLCLCSKNNEQDVQAVFAERLEFPLQVSHFTAMRLNWETKSANLKSLAAELGLGLDSFIFLDDNPVECAEVQANCPGVMVLQLPENPHLIPQFLNHCWAFDHLRVTEEDRRRAERYQQNQRREQLRVEAPTLENFLAGLQLKVDMRPLEDADSQRVAQLTQRTNQFNFVTRRMTDQGLVEWMRSGSVLVVKVSDRFGDYGLVGAVLYRFESESLAVDNVLLSCRVLGRGIEHRILARLGELARERNARWVDIHFVPSARNQPALNFLDAIGLEFKQPQNGGSLFRIPAAYAAEIVFRPSAEGQSPTTARIQRETNQVAKNGSEVGADASFCRDIALNYHDINRIFAELGTSAAVRHRERRNYTGPSNELERKLCELWQDLLHVEPVGIEEDFFELGGHSLLAVRLFAEIQKMTGRKLPLVTIFQAPTIRHLASILSQTDGADSLLVPIQAQGDKPPLFLVHGAGGDVLWGYANLAMHLPADQPVYGVKSSIQSGTETQLQLEEMARDYLQAVRSRQPQGPYYLGGYCFGGNVAYEMARQLHLEGERVELVILLDAAPANAGYERLTWWRPGFPYRFFRNFGYWLADFRALPVEDRRKFASRKLRWMGRKLLRRVGLGAAKERFDLEEVIDPDRFPEHELALWQIHLEALVAHVERPYNGRVALLRTRGQPLLCSLEEDFCWGKLVRGGVIIKKIPGSHENIFMGRNVQILASELKQLLAASHATTDAGTAHLPPKTTEPLSTV